MPSKIYYCYQCNSVKTVTLTHKRFPKTYYCDVCRRRIMRQGINEDYIDDFNPKPFRRPNKMQSNLQGGDLMTIPTKKNPAIENLINSTNPSGRNRVDSIQHDICTWCGSSCPPASFRNEISRREFAISGFCQACQDKTFGAD